MGDFFQVFSLVLIALCIVNLISSIYPNTKNKHTLMVVFSIVSVYLCITPVNSLIDSIRKFESFSVESVIKNFEIDSVDENYTDELKTILESQFEAEIEENFENVDADVTLGLKYASGGAENYEKIEKSAKTETMKNIEIYENQSFEKDKKSGNASLEVVEITICGATKEEEGEISRYVREKYEIAPVFRENSGF